MSDRDQILSRRARLIVAALAGLSAASQGGCDRGPLVCLSPPPLPPDAGPDAGDAGPPPPPSASPRKTQAG